MKFALNGAVTIGTLDGANVEIRDRVGDENIFIFGLTADEVNQIRQRGYEPASRISRDPALKGAIDAVENGLLSPDDPGRFRAITNDLKGSDHFLITADFTDYARTQRRVDTAFRDRQRWQRMSAANMMRTGWFSSDRSIREYAEKIWSVPIEAAR
jgi:starch phosphorylase